MITALIRVNRDPRRRPTPRFNRIFDDPTAERLFLHNHYLFAQNPNTQEPDWHQFWSRCVQPLVQQETNLPPR